MDNTDKPKFTQIMLGMADNFRDTITEEGMHIRFSMLKEYSIVQVAQAAKKIMATRRYTKMPPVAEFIDAIQGPAPQIEDQAIVQATMILDHLQRYGASMEPFLDDPITRQLMSGRWPYRQWASRVLESELKWWAKEFCEAYRAHTRVERPMIENKQLKLIASGMLKGV